MLDKCVALQWKPSDLDWSQKPRSLSRDDEMAIVQLFTDMAGIERLAGALFVEQEKRAEDPTLKAIFATFVQDEVRHAQVAQMLADFYDVHHYRLYQLTPALARFTPAFVDAIRYLSDDVANAYITVGELILDIALLRSINDYVHDGMSAQAMRLVNRDESRHIAIDYAMVEYYSSPAYDDKLAARRELPAEERLRGARAFAQMLYWGQPFFREVFFRPMDRVDPSGARMIEAFRRVQMIGAKPGVNDRPFGKFMQTLQNVYRHPVGRRLVGGVVARVAGLEPRFMEQVATEADMARARGMTFAELADDALAVKGDA